MGRLIRQVTDVRVRYADTDQMRMVYYGKFFEYFEQGRSDLLRSIGLSYGQFEEMGYFLPVIEAHAVYRKSARYDDLLNVATHLREMPVARVRLDYEVMRENDVIVEGHTVHSFVTASTGKPTRAPARFLEAVEQAMRKG
ncbi:MAG: acyl-CoA thioesterase [Ignavibacteria bacterium]|nr:acyl-CoA thioesterase [Ignavibacteria bacterium]